MDKTDPFVKYTLPLIISKPNEQHLYYVKLDIVVKPFVSNVFVRTLSIINTCQYIGHVRTKTIYRRQLKRCMKPLSAELYNLARQQLPRLSLWHMRMYIYLMRVFECRIVAGAKTKKEVKTTHKNNVGGTVAFEEILTFDKPLGEHTIKVIPHLLSWYLFSLSYAPTHQCMSTCMNMCAIFNLNLNECALAKMKFVSLVCFPCGRGKKKIWCFFICVHRFKCWIRTLFPMTWWAKQS